MELVSFASQPTIWVNIQVACILCDFFTANTINMASKTIKVIGQLQDPLGIRLVTFNNFILHIIGTYGRNQMNFNGCKRIRNCLKL